jgi:Fe2+ or Zn2+ uptake regulation protein
MAVIFSTIVRAPDELTDLFRATGRKVTAQRQCIFRVLEGDVAHPSAESVYEAARAQMETISLKTVYQTLHELAELGEIAALDLGTGMVRFDPNVEASHHHLVCGVCGKVRDVAVELPDLAVPAGAEQGYEVERTEVVFRGLCEDCRRARVRPGRARSPARTRLQTHPRVESQTRKEQPRWQH